jgi:ferredoxin--NADP+ reductase
MNGTRTGTPGNPARIAIIGSGPAGFYTAEHLLKSEDATCEVDIFDRLPTPYGLVRAGVAPDHPKIKSVTRVYERTAAREGFRYFGAVEIGKDISLEDLQKRYHAIVLAYGSSTDRKLGIPGEDLAGSHAATEFVNWYNAHPDFADRRFDLTAKRAVVIGNGNVAADVARMLALTKDELSETDTADHAIEALPESGIEEIIVLGRRGPAQAAFTNPELRELSEMIDADLIIDPAEAELDPASRDSLDSDDGDPTNRRNVEMIQEFAQSEPEGRPKRIILRFCASPVEILGDGKVEKLVVARNELVSDGDRISAKDTGEREEIECGLIFRSIGYRGVPMEGVPFDEDRGTIANDAGRVIELDSGEQVPGLYTVGWIKRGPSGVIGTNKKDAQETADNLIADIVEGKLPEAELAGDAEATPSLLAERKPDAIGFDQWQKIDAAEIANGEPQGRPRVKFTSIPEMLDTAKGS